MSAKKKLTAAVRKARKKPGGSNVGRYKGERTIGQAGGAPKGSFPVTQGGKLSKKRIRAAISYARDAPNPAGIQAKARKLLKEAGGMQSATKKKGKRARVK